MKNIIAFSGPKNSGKSTAKNLLLQSHPNAICLSFADPLKKCVTALFGLTDECYDPIKKETILPQWNVSPRQLMQTIGTDFIRDNLKSYFPQLQMSQHTFFCSIMHDTIQQLDDNSLIIIDDCRFQDEYNLIKSLNGKVIKITRETTEDSHKSEHGTLYDHIIQNDSTIENLKTKLKDLIFI